MFEIIDCSSFDYDLIEQLGSKEKFWLLDNGQSKLFKKTRTGENWSEKIAYELCKVLGIPCAHYDLAAYHGEDGVLSTSIVPENCTLRLGNELMLRSRDTRQLMSKINLKRHSVNLVWILMSEVIKNKPVGFNSLPNIRSAVDFFVGYVALDTLISNQDRHYQNWGIIIGDEHLSLAPTFDHAASLGRNESDSVRKERLATKDTGRTVDNYVRRSKSYFYDHNGKRLRNVEAFSAFARLAPTAANEWVARIQALDLNQLVRLFDMIPDSIISVAGKEFGVQMIRCNQEQLSQVMIDGH